jgi:hypothetical membrane protein
MSLRKVGLCCGIISPVVWLALIAAAGALRPDFHHFTQYISELGERGSSTEALMRYGAFGFTGFLYIGFAAAVLGTLQDGWLQRAAAVLIALDGLGRMGAGVFPCDPGCVQVSPGPDLHKLFATIGFSSGISAALLWGFILRRVPPLRSLSSFSVGSGAVSLVSLLLMSRTTDPALGPGLFEHLATVMLSVWLLVFARRLLRADLWKSDSVDVRRAT